MNSRTHDNETQTNGIPSLSSRKTGVLARVRFTLNALNALNAWRHEILVDVQLPRRIANWLNEERHDAAPVVPKKEISPLVHLRGELAATHEHKTLQTLKGYTRFLQADILVGSPG